VAKKMYCGIEFRIGGTEFATWWQK